MYGFCGSFELFILLVVCLIVVAVVWRRRHNSENSVAHSPTAGIYAPEGEEPPASFADVVHRAEALRGQVQAGQLSEAECKQRMRELMKMDAGGVWWMVGYESGAWYRHDGNDWVRDDSGPNS